MVSSDGGKQLGLVNTDSPFVNSIFGSSVATPFGH